MAKFKNVSPLGALDVPALGRVIEPDEEFEVRADLAGLFAGQAANYEPVDTAAKRAAKQARSGKPVEEATESTDPTESTESTDPTESTESTESGDGSAEQGNEEGDAGDNAA